MNGGAVAQTHETQVHRAQVHGAQTRGAQDRKAADAQDAGRASKAVHFRDLSWEESTDLVYFSSASENTRRFVERLARPATRIPLRPKLESMIRVARPYVLIVPSYGGGELTGALPRQVAMFLNDRTNRSLIRGVITSGNTNFGEHYCIAGPVIAQKCGIPELYRFELLGTQRDVDQVNDGLNMFWARIGLHEDAPNGHLPNPLPHHLPTQQAGALSSQSISQAAQHLAMAGSPQLAHV